MSAQASRTVIDSLEFARTGQILRGTLSISGLARLHDSLFDTLGLVDFVVQGGHDARQRATLSLEVSGVLHLKCQRCLGQFDFPLRLGSTLRLANALEMAAVEADEDDAECIEPSPALDVASLVEDEIILGLPYSPRHPEVECRAGLDDVSRRAGRPVFARLAALKRDPN
jgi:uncharacterized protein